MKSNRILVIDDEPLILKAVQTILAQDGHTIETASDPAEALRKFDSDSFDLVVTDLRLPGMQGDELAEEMQRRKPSQRIIMLTAFPPATVPAAIEFVLPKPTALADLAKIIARML